MKIQDIKQYENNAKQHTDEQIEGLAKSIARFGWQQPIKLGKDNVIVAGHGRLLAYNKYHEELDIKTPWCINEKGETVLGEAEKRKLTKVEEIAYRMADNEWNSKTGSDQGLIRDDLQILKDEGFDIGLTGYDESLLNDPKIVDTGTEISLDDLDEKSKIVLAYSSKDYLEALELLGSYKEQYDHETNEEAILSILRQMAP